MKRDDRKASTAETWIGRREFLTRAAAVGLLFRPCRRSRRREPRRRIRVRDRGRPFEGVKLSLGKAPHGENEQELFKRWLAPFEEETGATVEHTIVPWRHRELGVSVELRGADAVRRHLPGDTGSDGPRHARRARGSGAVPEAADFASERKHFPDSFIRPSLYEGKLYGLPFIIGTIVMFYNKRMLAEAGVSSSPEDDDRARGCRR